MKVVVDRSRCTGLGLCEAAAPDNFEIADNGDLVVLQEEVTAGQLEDVRDAVLACPTEALKLLED